MVSIAPLCSGWGRPMERDRSHSPAGASKNRLALVLGITTFYLVAEVIGGILTDSLALLADAGHMLTDVAGIGLALLAIRFAERPATPARTYGYYRAEILAAVTNAVVLVGISIYILYEAYQRFLDPRPVSGGWMLAISALGLAVNLVGMALLRSGSSQSLNVKGAYFEVLSDALSSVGVLFAAAVIWSTGWYYADPLVSAGIGLFILPRTWVLLKEATGVLLEGTPADLNLASVRAALEALPGVAGVHDLHAWSLTSGFNALSAHVVLDEEARLDEVLTSTHRKLTSTFSISHVTIQVEPTGWQEAETHL